MSVRRRSRSATRPTRSAVSGRRMRAVRACRVAEGEALALAARVGSPAIDVTGLAKRYGDVVAVADLCVRVERDRSSFSPNGAGKTTSVKMLLGLVTPSALGQRSPGAARRSAARASDAGSEPLSEWLTAREELKFHASLARLPRIALARSSACVGLIARAIASPAIQGMQQCWGWPSRSRHARPRLSPTNPPPRSIPSAP